MSGFKDIAEIDARNVFLNLNEFAEALTVKYDERTFPDIPVVLTKVKEQDRRQNNRYGADDPAQGLFLITAIMCCAAVDLDGVIPEKGSLIAISDSTYPNYYHRFKVASSSCEHGLIRLELGAIDE